MLDKLRDAGSSVLFIDIVYVSKKKKKKSQIVKNTKLIRLTTVHFKKSRPWRVFRHEENDSMVNEISRYKTFLQY